MRYRSLAFSRGAVTVKSYGASAEAVLKKGVEWLTFIEPGSGNIWPERVEIHASDTQISGNRSAWTLIASFPYSAVPESLYAWKNRRAERAARRLP